MHACMKRNNVPIVFPDLTDPCAKFQCAVELIINSNCFCDKISFMRNRAKCKKCQFILESFTIQDYVECSCGEISIWGGNQFLHCSAKNWDNFLRVDDKDQEIQVVFQEKELESNSKPNKKELLDMLKSMIESYEKLPKEAIHSFVTASELLSLMLLLQAIFLSEDA